MFHNLVRGITVLGNGQSMAYLFGSSLFGMLGGVLPGLGGPVLLTIVLALIYHVSLTGVLCIFLAIHAASFFTSSITAILLNTPQHPESFAVTFDGFPMAQSGQAGRALGISAAATCLGGFIGCLVLVGFIQVMNDIPTLFHPPEYVALILIALLLVGTLGTDAVSKAVISMGLGIMVAAIGQDPITGVFRYTFNSIGLYDGVSLVGLALGLFAIPQMLLLFGVADRVARQDMTGREVGQVAAAEIGEHFGRQVIGGVGDTFRHWGVTVRAGLVGALTGLVPGIGAFAANFMSYGIAQQSSRRRELFGTGIPEGIIAAEGSSLSKEAGHMVPLLALGIPGGVGSALFLAALTIKDVHIGYNFTVNYPVLPYEMMWIIAFGGLIGTSIGLLAAPWLARVTMIPGPCLVPVIMGLSVVGAYVSATNFFTVVEVLIFSAIGLVLRRLRYAIAVLVIALVLGPSLESNIYLTHEIYSGWSFLARPFTDVLIAIAIGVVALKVSQQRADNRKERESYSSLEGAEREEAIAAYVRRRHPYPLLGALTTTSILAIAIAALLYAVTHYNFITTIVPVIGCGLAAMGSLSRMPADIGAHIAFRRHRASGQSAAPGAMPQTAAQPEELRLVTAGATIPGGLGERSSLQDEVPLAPTEPSASPEVGHLPSPIREKAWGWQGQYSREIAGLGWFGALLAACFVFGFYIGPPAWCLAYSLTSLHHTFRRRRPRIIFGLLVALALWGQTFLMFRLVHLHFAPLINL